VCISGSAEADSGTQKREEMQVRLDIRTCGCADAPNYVAGAITPGQKREIRGFDFILRFWI